MNNVAGTVTGGAGNDVITGGNGNDVINGGDGKDTITISYGTDLVTGGAGNDTFDIDATGSSASAQASSFTNTANGDAANADDALSVTINGVSYVYTTATAGTLTATEYATAFVAQYRTTILAQHGVTVSNLDGQGTASAVLTFTGASTGASFSIAARDYQANAGTGTALTVTTTAGAVARDVNTTITDYAVGDVIDTAGLNGLGTAYFEGAAADLSDATNYGVIVLTNTSYATAQAAADAVDAKTDDGNDTNVATIVIFLNSTTGKAEAIYIADYDSNPTIAATDLLLTFDNITTLTGMAAVFSSDGFSI